MRINSIPIDLNKVQNILNNSPKIRSCPRIDSLTRSYDHGNSRIRLFGGVSLDFDSSTLNEQKADRPRTSQVHIRYISEEINFKACRRFPFQPQEKCIECSSELSLSEISKCRGTMHCTYHNPLLCQSCYKLLEGNCVQNQGKSSHSECFICQLCKDIILPRNEFVIVDSCNFHPSCSKIFNENIARVRELYYQLKLEDEILRQAKLHTGIEDARESNLFHETHRIVSDRVDIGRIIDSDYSQVVNASERNHRYPEDESILECLGDKAKNDILSLCRKGYEQSQVLDLYLAHNQDIDIVEALLYSIYHIN